MQAVRRGLRWTILAPLYCLGLAGGVVMMLLFDFFAWLDAEPGTSEDPYD